jgi:hypothetical protein
VAQKLPAQFDPMETVKPSLAPRTASTEKPDRHMRIPRSNQVLANVRLLLLPMYLALDGAVHDR